MAGVGDMMTAELANDNPQDHADDNPGCQFYSPHDLLLYLKMATASIFTVYCENTALALAI
jgi:hypothetical protein